ncbi:hypothetical protein HS088_TW17G00138 [Tripterygium wilfordii]|uniref:Uncharacterized protein n=1 Tax=Tripterygium wilfordii TaxID=458696 RepID=A0A7J7CEP3_TRIWF|nr:uncharacterized protein LOC119982796 [Tripterygium wilfordii]XP_038682293.1 uncharacterized protein LOC119982796 [Tripterygium wilfordii]KAF5732608.1 hypothetical protein HS088_TW17G00138 [Tripterygium wilfordii]
MLRSPSLVSLVVKAIDRDLICGGDDLSDIYELPSELFDLLVASLCPMALEKLLSEMPFDVCNDNMPTSYFLKKDRKRGRNWNLNEAWKNLVKLRWPELSEIELDDWQQVYWETHLQNCLDEAAELALLPSFDGCISEIKISDRLLKYVGCLGYLTRLSCDYSTLSYHCEQFGYYARYLRLPSVLCVAQTCRLLRNSKLEILVLRWIRSKEHIDGLCKLLIQNSATLTTLEFIHCSLSSAFVNAIFSSLHRRSGQAQGIQDLSIKTSNFLEPSLVSLPLALATFLSSGRPLHSLKFSDNHLDQNCARMVLSALLDASSCLSILDLSENHIAGWLSNFCVRSSSGNLSSFGSDKYLKSLRELNLRQNDLNKDDADNLRCLFFHMPNLKILDISDNPIGDDGIRCLIPYFVEASVEGRFHLTEMNLQCCELSCEGVTQLLETLSTLKTPLRSLSLADNVLGSQVAGVLGNFLHTSIQVLDVGGIGLGSSGFQELLERITGELKLTKVNISKNHGGIGTAKFLSKLFSLAPELVKVNATYNFLPVESLPIICSGLKVAKGKLDYLDLRGNFWESQPAHASMFANFRHNGKPIVILESTPASNIPYDDDP